MARKPRNPKTSEVAPAVEPVVAPVVEPAMQQADIAAPILFAHEALRFIAFGDLHVKAETIDRALEVLRRVGRLAVEHRAIVVCCGDFWDQRGAIWVRHADAVLTVLDEWRAQGVQAVFVPGNHDQVTLDGSIHGARLFAAYANIRVATDPILWSEQKIAFLPWREEGQDALFTALPGNGWTIFAHAEVQGASTNAGHKAPGRVSLAQIETHARACYVSHYHLRHKLGECTWYLGSPFEMNFGERDQPHGVALISTDKVEPTWITWDDFPKHHVVPLEDAMALPVRPIDFVEVQWSPKTTQRDEVDRVLKCIDANVRQKPVQTPEEKSAPMFAFTIEQAIEIYAKDQPAGVLSLGRELLAEVKGKQLGALGKLVRIKSVAITNFCAIRGRIEVQLDRQGLLLLRGDQGIGKTSITDSITWCFYGTTTPRKAGADGSALKADEVVNDLADAALVEVTLDVDGQEVVTTREKKRGKGSRVKIRGAAHADGISDGDDLAQHVIGLDYGLWRALVSLGQGAVGNFITGADKKRKEMLSSAFGLERCPQALDRAKALVKRYTSELQNARVELLSMQKALEMYAATDFAVHIAEWNAQQQSAILHARRMVEEAQLVIAECDKHLAGEAQWLESKRAHEEHLTQVLAQLSSLSQHGKLVELQRELGGIQAERSMLERDLTLKGAQLTQMIDAAKAGPVPCPVCGKPFEASTSEQHIEALEKGILSLRSQVKTFDLRGQQAQLQIAQVEGSQEAQRASLQQTIGESRKALEQVNQALQVFGTIRANRTAAEQKVSVAQHEQARQLAAHNPFEAKQREAEEQRRVLDAKIVHYEAEMKTAELSLSYAQFWVEGYGQKGVPALVLRTALYDLELQANRFLSTMLQGSTYCQLTMEEDDLDVQFFQIDPFTREARERRYEQLSGGERRCVELAFSPFALGELIYARAGVRVSMLLIDELTTHLGNKEKGLVCALLRELDRETILVIDHDVGVQGEFDHVLDLTRDEVGVTQLLRVR